jgi:acetyl-CoA C-acetyltransferase
MGRFGGCFRAMPVFDLASRTIQALLSRLEFPAERIDEVLIGHCRQAGNGPNPGRTASVRGGIPRTVPVTTINMACPSGMKALEIASMRLLLGQARFVLVGGMESMSTMPYLLKDCRWEGFKMGNRALLDGWVDSTDPLIGMGMGDTAEVLNERYGIPRENQDALAARSHELAHRAWEEGAFEAEVVAIDVGETRVHRDETIRFPVDRGKMAKLPAAFKNGGTVTAGNTCAMADGAAFVLVTTADVARAEGLPILGELAAFAQGAVDPATMGEGPARVIPKLLEEMGVGLDTIDLLEVNEAFAVQVLANERDLGWSRDRLNVHGGAIALGHPTGCSGVRIVVTLLHALGRRGKEYGVASLCGAGGVTMATGGPATRRV